MEFGPAGAAVLCQLRLDEALHSGPVRDLSPMGFVVETEVEVEVGTELDLRLLGAAAPGPVYLRAVVEQRLRPTELAPDGVLGLRLRILRFDRDYGALLGTPRARDAATPEETSASRARADSAEREWLVSLVDSTPVRGAGPERAAETESSWGDGGSSDLESLRAVSTSGPPDVLVVDEGELEDVVWLLEELGVEPERRALAPGLEDWVAPRRLLLVSARRALALRLPLRGREGDFVSIAVTDGETQTVEAAMQRLGYRMVVRRPVHPQALRTLLREALFEGASRRKVPRQALGCEVRWRSGWWQRHRGVLLDLSLRGCRLLSPVALPAGAAISLRIPGEVTGGRALRLHGYVARAGHVTGAEGGGMALGIEFGALRERVRVRLDRLLAESERGPRRLVGAPALAAPAPGTPLPDRRRTVRSELREEVLALDPLSAQVEHSLRGRDLSIQGVRVEPHPELALGAKLRLVIRGPAQLEPLLVDAEVLRDDGPLGLWLRFLEVGPAMRRRIEGAVAALPAVVGTRQRKTPGR